MSALDRLSALATTGVGGLPFDDPAVAVRHAARAYDVPFCPQLPHFDGDMVREWLGAEWSRTPCGGRSSATASGPPRGTRSRRRSAKGVPTTGS